MSKSKDIRVLLVNDEQTLLEFLSKRLLREGFTVKVTFCGEEALQAAADKTYDVAVVDINMPGMDGIQTQKLLKEIQPDLQCIILTGLSNPDDLPQDADKHAYRFLVKPVDFESLMQSIREAHKFKLKLQKEKKTDKDDIVEPSSDSSILKRMFWKMKKLYGVPNE